VLITDTLRVVNPSTMRFKTEVTSGAGIVAWDLDARQRDGVSKEAAGQGDVPAVIDWPLDAEKTMIPRNENDITYRLQVRDAANQEASSPTHAIPVEQNTVQKKRSSVVVEDKEIDRYNLILFDFGSTALSAQNKEIVDFIRQRVTPEATVRITGYTDRIGDAEFNRKLSDARSKSVATELGATNALVNGAGETNLYNNDLPEGRFYCRTVSVVVETPVKK
jgi:outer membrane protein OmpA-like peptidoglycan-associated protein